ADARLLVPTRVEQPDETPEVTVVHDLAVVLAGLGIVAVERLQVRDETVDERSLDGLVHQDVIGRDTRLARVDELAVHDAARGAVEVDIAIDDRRTLPAELERDRRQMLRSRLHHDARDVRAARVENVL